MKTKIVLIIVSLLFVCQFAYSQSEIKKAPENLKIKTSFTIGPIYPIEFGNTALAKAHSYIFGFTSTLGLLKYSNFSAGFGVDYVSYSVKNKQIIGDYQSSNHNSLFIFLNYDYDLNNKWTLTPNIGYGTSELVIRKDGKRRGSQDGKEFRIGSSINYNLNKNNAFCFSLLYVNNNYNVKANESIKDFFKKSNSIQLGIIYRTK